MNRLKLNNFNGITEFKNELKSSDIKIWIYTLPVKDLDKKHRENYDNIKFLKKENKDILIIEFNENLIGSFDEIKNWGEIKYTKGEYRNIQANISTERKLLERMLLQEIRQSSDKSKYEIINNEKNCVYIKQALLDKDNIILKRKINFDVNINEDENIIVGFDLSHSYDYISTLAEELNIVGPGDKVKDYYNHIVYEFVSVAEFSISDVNEYMQCSIIDYYKNKNQSYIVDKLNPKTKAVLVSKNKNIFPYIPNRLKRVCDYGNLESRILKECSEHTKLSAHKKMKLSIDITKDILEEYSMSEIKTIVPPIKCQGIKTKLVPFIKDNIIRNPNGTWIEPFVGTGVVAFNLAPQRAFLLDKNQYIIKLYQNIQKGFYTGKIVRDFLEQHGAELEKRGGDYYLHMRNEFNNNGDPLYFLFLNRSDFNGMIRFNSKGKFNVPFCRKPNRFAKAYITKICNQVDKVASIMKDKDWIFKHGSWQEAFDVATEDDYIYLDPPYI